MRNVGIASHTPRCCHVALLQGQGPGLDRWRACAWDEALEAVDTLAAHIHPTVWLLAAGCWQPTLTPGTSELCLQVPKRGPAICPRTGHAAGL